MSTIPVIQSQPAHSPKSRLIALILCLVAGSFGIHRFYVEKIVTGILYLCTGGLFGIGVFIDLILIAVGSFRDAAGLPLTEWDENPQATTVVSSYQPPYPQQPYPTQQPIGRKQPDTFSTVKSNSKICVTCGSLNDLSATFCVSCGSKLD